MDEKEATGSDKGAEIQEGIQLPLPSRSRSESTSSTASGKQKTGPTKRSTTSSSASSLPQAQSAPPASSDDGSLPVAINLWLQEQYSLRATVQELCEQLSGQLTSLNEVTYIQETLDRTVKEFKSNHISLISAWPPAHLSHPYVKGDYSKGFRSLCTALGKEIAKAQGRFAPIASSPPPTTVSSNLPKINLPSFDSNYHQWLNFSALFKILVLENKSLKSVEQLHYLRGCVTGEAAQLIGSLPLVDESMETAWTSLTQRYSNRRLLVQAQLDRLFKLPQASSRSSSSIGQLISTMSDAIKVLQALNVPDLADVMMVYLASQHIDWQLSQAWETQIGGCQEYPAFSRLEAFLTSKARALERVEAKLIPARQTTTAHHATAQPTPTTPAHKPASIAPAQPTRTATFVHSSTAHPCDSCGGNHYIVTCSAFKQLDPAARRQLLVEKRLCFNCMGRHSVNACRSTTKCKTCSARHHTMIHMPPRDPSSPAQLLTSSSAH